MMSRPLLLILFPCFFWLFQSCQSDKPDQPIVAKVGEHYYSLDDLNKSIPNNLSAEDSAELASNLIQTWMMGELMYDKAQYNLGDEQVDIEKQVANYRKDLFIFEYEKQLVIQKLDTTVSEKEISDFYNENNNMFQLNDYILKVTYVKVLPSAPEIDKVKAWMKTDDSENKEKLMDYCHRYAVKCFTDTSWVYFNELLTELPIQVYNKEAFLREGNLVDFRDTDHLYLLLIREIQSKNTTSPLNLERERIRNLILNKRKIELLSTIRRRIYRDAVSSGKAEVYAKPQIPQ